MQLSVTNCPAQSLVFSNCVFVNSGDYPHLKARTASDEVYLQFGRFVYLAKPHEAIPSKSVGMSGPQRKCGAYTLEQSIPFSVYEIGVDVALNSVTFGVDLQIKKPDKITIDCPELEASFKQQFLGHVFTVGQEIPMDFGGLKLMCHVESFEHASIDGSSATKGSHLGQVIVPTACNFHKASGSPNNLLFTGGVGPARNDNLFKEEFDFEKMGIGGLGKEFNTILRKAFAPRIYPGLVKQLGINFIRGMLLYGAPGCGKTLIARQIGKVLNARDPIIVNGPELLDKFVGGSEDNVRKLFVAAEKEQAEMGDASMLHIIIFDEMDAIMKKRGSGSDSTGTHDGVVNQLLSKIDGVDSLNNVLIIGMTNRKDMIDEAILRPGRLELHVEIGLPDEAGRVQILNIHTMKMRTSKRISQEAVENLPELSRRTKNYTGAELEGMVRSAVSFALSRHIDPSNLKAVDESKIIVEWNDFERAVLETVPAFGSKSNEEMQNLFRNGLVDYGAGFSGIIKTLNRLMQQCRTSERTPLMSVLLEGFVGTGKSAIAASICANSDFPFIRLISPDTMIGMDARGKCGELQKVFSDAYRSTLSVILIDDIERILEYTPVGPNFSNSVLQTLIILLRKPPPTPGRRLIILATTSIADLLESLQLSQAFNITVHVSQLQSVDEYTTVLAHPDGGNIKMADAASIARTISKPIGVKQLLMTVEMARASADDGRITADIFQECLNECGF